MAGSWASRPTTGCASRSLCREHAQGLAVHRQHPSPPLHGYSSAQLLNEPADHGVERVGDRDERAGPGRDRAHRHGEQHDQPMPDPACLTGVNHSPPRAVLRAGASTTGSGSSILPRCSAMAGMDKDAVAGTALFR